MGSGLKSKALRLSPQALLRAQPNRITSTIPSWGRARAGVTSCQTLRLNNAGVDQADQDAVHSLFRVSCRSDLPAMRRSRGRAAGESRLDATQFCARLGRPA
jgi:hypothetical protein